MCVILSAGRKGNDVLLDQSSNRIPPFLTLRISEISLIASERNYNGSVAKRTILTTYFWILNLNCHPSGHIREGEHEKT